MRTMLREAPDAAELAALYPAPHDHTRWPDHRIRVARTIAMAAEVLPRAGTVADLSCGDAAIARSLQQTHAAHVILGDFAPGYEFEGPIEQTALCIAPGAVDLWVLSETLEHLADPDHVLRLIRERARHLILSTPDGEPDALPVNREHVWSWRCGDVEEMLRAAGWTPTQHQLLKHPAGGIYSFQLWACE